MMTMSLGYVLGRVGQPFDWSNYLFALLGISLCSGSAAALNHAMEKDLDAKMDRTKNRPLPSGKLAVNTVLLFSLILLLLGSAVLYFKVNVLTMLLCLWTVLLYDFVYTPLKRLSWLNTFVGAIPGAMPVLCGWAAAMNHIPETAWSFFIIIAVWQLPHFFSIAWMYKDAYKNAGFKMLTAYDETGRITGLHIVSYTLLLIAMSILPYLKGVMGPVYLIGILITGFFFLWHGIKFYKDPVFQKARYVLRASLIYPPILILLVFLDLAL
jgi:protoheme IX farnesyltransferase